MYALQILLGDFSIDDTKIQNMQWELASFLKYILQINLSLFLTASLSLDVNVAACKDSKHF